jgi:PKD repeat protein
VGSYDVSLTATNAKGSDTGTRRNCVTVDPPAPVADFTVDKRAGTAPLVAHFTDTSTNTPTAWDWTFGDGGASGAPNPSHTYREVGRYTVTLTVGNASGSNTKTQPGCISVTFPDVASDFWAADAILSCVSAGIVSGYPEGTYRPDGKVTRDQMAAYISRALAGGDAKISSPAVASFPDVPTDAWSFKYVEYAKAKQIVSGYSDNTYRPTQEVTRDQMAVYIARAVVNPTGDGGLAGYTPPATPSFADVPADNWAYKYIEYAKAQNIVKGYPDGYRPAVVVTRDQMAVYVARAFELQ